MVVTVCFYFMFFCYFYNARRVKAVKLKLLDISSVNWKKKKTNPVHSVIFSFLTIPNSTSL